MICKRLAAVVAIATALALPAADASASGPALLSTTPAANATGTARYAPSVIFTYDQPVVVNTPATLVRTATGAPVAASLAVNGAAVTVSTAATLLPGTRYTATVQPDGAAAPDSVTFTTLGGPAHPAIRVKIVTALDDAATQDIVRRLDRANLLAIPRSSDVVDVSAAAGRPLAPSDLYGYSAALVVTDRDMAGQDAAASVLAGFAAHGHGVVAAGQTHWKVGAQWTASSAISTQYSSDWAVKWSPFGLTDPIAIQGGALAASSVNGSHFVTRMLTAPFVVTGYGSGEVTTQTSWNCQVLARLQKTAAYPTYGQALVTVRENGNGRVVDLGFRPWSSSIAGGGFDPSVTAGGALVARSLWWAANRIPPSGTHYTVKPSNPSRWTSVLFTAKATDPDDTALKYHYQVNGGPWHVAPSATFALYHLTSGRFYTVRTFAVDPAGNRDPHVASWTFRVG